MEVKMSRTLLQEIAHQIFYTPPKKKRKKKVSKKGLSYKERKHLEAMYKHKLKTFENRKAYEIAKLKAKSWL